jgi:hypothetical protein
MVDVAAACLPTVEIARLLPNTTERVTMKIIREALADKGGRTVAAGYSRLNWQMLMLFTQRAAQREAEQRADCKSISLQNRERDGRITPEFTLMGHRGECLAKYYPTC